MDFADSSLSLSLQARQGAARRQYRSLQALAAGGLMPSWAPPPG